MQQDNNLPSGRAYVIAREGWVFILLFGAVSGLFSFLGIHFLAIPMLLLTLFTVYFFRNPERVGPVGDGLVLSPADGTVVEISEPEKNDYTEGKAKKVGIFM